jgi:predicted heme/steroid binding protein
MVDLKKFTTHELSSFNGKDGKPAYIGFKGKVYDVTDSVQWSNGDHLGHEAGHNLTEDMIMAPHSEGVLDELKIVGLLV